jgi:ribokinase
MAIINFGSINIDHVYSVPHFVTPGETLSSSNYHSVLGGKGANQSISCALAGGNIKHVGSIHANDKAYTQSIRDAGVDCSNVIEQTNVASGHAIIQVNEEGENAIVLFAGANHALDLPQINAALEHATSDDWVLLQNETNAIDLVINAAHEKGLKIAFNPAPMTKEVMALPLDKVDLLIVNEVEAMQLVSANTVADAEVKLRERFPNSQILLTLGKQGVRFMHAQTMVEVPAFSVDAIDTTAAGDTFIGYFLKSYVDATANTNDMSVAALTGALQTACAASAICVTRAGAAPSIPHADEVAAFLKVHV